jgi:hypothetical protein
MNELIPWTPVPDVEWRSAVNALFAVPHVSKSLNKPMVRFFEVLIVMQSRKPSSWEEILCSCVRVYPRVEGKRRQNHHGFKVHEKLQFKES